MISLTLFVYLSVYLSVYLPIYLSIDFISICPSLFAPSNSNTSPIEFRYEHFCRQLSPLVSLPFFPSRFFFSFLICHNFFSCYVSFFSFFSFSCSFSFFTYLSPFCVETVTLFELKRWSFYSSQCSSRFNFYSTVVLSLIKIPTKKKQNKIQKKNDTYPDTLFPSQ